MKYGCGCVVTTGLFHNLPMLFPADPAVMLQCCKFGKGFVTAGSTCSDMVERVLDGGGHVGDVPGFGSRFGFSFQVESLRVAGITCSDMVSASSMAAAMSVMFQGFTKMAPAPSDCAAPANSDSTSTPGTETAKPGGVH